ncbi:TPA_asm: L [Justicia betacytorhabdovirus 1]|nr:TPA_asm: L [Justicia betacytorhabdovirus 1]
MEGIGSLIEELSYADESIMELLGSGKKISNNLPGLGDFHLQSALKEVPERVLNCSKGRDREIMCMRSLQKALPDFTVISKPPCCLLITEMLSDHQPAYKGIIRDSTTMSRAVDNLRARIMLENDIGRMSKLSGKPLNSPWLTNLKLIGGRTDYSYRRYLWNQVVTLMNCIGSGRDHNPEWSELYNIKLINKGESLMCVDGWLYALDSESDRYLLTGELIAAVDYTNKLAAIYDINAVRQLSDKLTERDIVIRASRLGNSVNPEIYPSDLLIQATWEIGDDCITSHKNHGYKLIKCYEAICIGVLLERSRDLISDRKEFLTNVTSELLQEHPEFKKFVDRLLNLLRNVESNHHISQLYGLYRLWGHPSVVSKKGLEKVMKIGKREKIISKELSRLAGYHFLEMIFFGYFKKNGFYPEFKTRKDSEEKSLTTSYLITCLNGKVKFDPSNSNYDVMDWSHVKVLETFSVPETFNLAMIVDDKAISPDKHYLVSVAEGRNSLMNPMERRGVLKFLSSQDTRCREFLLSINKKGLDDEHCVIGLYPKERELNSIPRMFSLMSSHMRNYVVITEHMLAHDILPFFPQITMTNNLLDLTKKIYGATRKQERSGSSLSENDARDVGLNIKSSFSTKYISVCINMDFEKWNLNMRKEATDGVFKNLGRLYGMKHLFNRTYDMFKKSFIYVADDDAKIKTENNPRGSGRVLRTDDEFSYTGHIGGHEGLRQKGWTIFTVVVIKMVCQRHMVSYKLMGQGDNQVLMINLYTSKLDRGGHFSEEGILEMKNKLSNVITDLDLTFGALGLPLKTMESWKSESLFLYGKFPVMSGVPLSMSLKKMCRCFPFSNDDTMTVDNVLGSIFTNAQAATMSELSFHLPYYMSLMEGFFGLASILIYHPLLGKGLKDLLGEKLSWKDRNLVNENSFSIENVRSVPTLYEITSNILLCPKSLTGSNGITQFEFSMRGFPDNQSRDAAYLFAIREQKPVKIMHKNDHLSIFINAQIKTARNMTRLIFEESRNAEFLVEDPCAINLLNPTTPLSMIRKRVKTVIEQSGMIKNENFQQMFKIASDSNKKQLCDMLISNKSLFPRLIHDLYAATLYGYVDGIVSKVDKTSTIQKIGFAESQEDIMRVVMIAEGNFLRFLIWRSNHYRTADLTGEPKGDCPTRLMKWARYYGWGKEILGVTVPFPQHILSNEVCTPGNHLCEDNSFVSGYISGMLPSLRAERFNKLGMSPPYLGSYTKEKIKTYEKVALYGSEPLLTRAINTLRTVGWAVEENSNTYDMLCKILKSLCDIDPQIFITDDDHSSGTLDHRYRDSALKHGALMSCLYTPGTWTHISTDTLLDYSKGSKNVTLHFQALLCWIQGILSDLIIYNEEDMISQCYHFHMKCKSCIEEVTEVIPDIPVIPEKLIPEMKENPYCFVKDKVILRRDKNLFNEMSKLSFNKTIRVSDLTNKDIFQLIHEDYGMRMAQDILGGAFERGSDHVSSGLMEVGEYPRISFLRLNVYYTHACVLYKLLLSVYEKWARMNHTGSWSLSSASNEVKKMINSCPSSCFLGLSTFYSWPEKMKECCSIEGFEFPKEYPMNIEGACQIAKSNLISMLKYFDFSLIEESGMINVLTQRNLHTQLLGKLIYFYLRHEKKDSVCQSCIHVLTTEFTESLVGIRKKRNPRCIFKHLIPDEKTVLSKFFFVSFSVDVLEKAYTSVKLHTQLKRRLVSPSEEMSKINNKSIEIYSTKKMTNTAMRIEEKQEEVGVARLETEELSRIFRLIPYDESVAYRIFELTISKEFLSMRFSNILILGDGNGGSSIAIEQFFKSPIGGITQLRCDNSFPQSFPHAMPPNSLYCGISDTVNYKISTEFFFDLKNADSRNLLRSKMNQMNVQSVISEVEFEHGYNALNWEEGICKSRSDYIMLGYWIWTFECVEKSAFKVRFYLGTIIEDIRRAIELCQVYWRNVSVISTPHNSKRKGELWILVEDRVQNPNPLTITTIKRRSYWVRQIETIKKVFSEESTEDPDLEKYFIELNNLMMKTHRGVRSKNILNDWIRRDLKNVQLGRTYSWSRIIYFIISDRFPKVVWDMGVNQDKFLHSEPEMIMMMKLLCLIIGHCKSYVLLRSIIDHSDDVFVSWVVRKGVAMSDRRFNFNIVYSGKPLCVQREFRVRVIKLRSEILKENLLRFCPLIIHEAKKPAYPILKRWTKNSIVTFNRTRRAEREKVERDSMLLPVTSTLMRRLICIGSFLGEISETETGD